MSPSPQTIFVTGANGNLGRKVVQKLLDYPSVRVIAADIHDDKIEQHERVTALKFDLRRCQFTDLIRAHNISDIIHLACTVTPKGSFDAQAAYDLDVSATIKLYEAAEELGVARFIHASSGAAYGYYADNPALISEDVPIRGNDIFFYSKHKRLVEEYLKKKREESTPITQTVFRLCSILGNSLQNQITDLFFSPAVIGIKGCDSPFSFIWDEDAASAFAMATQINADGVFNLAGDGKIALPEIAALMGKPFIPLPVPLLQAALAGLQRIRLGKYGPEQTLYLQYRPVLDNSKLKAKLGIYPRKSSRECFLCFAGQHGLLRSVKGLDCGKGVSRQN